MTRIGDHIHRICKDQLDSSDAPITLAGCVQAFLADEGAMVQFGELRPIIEADWLRGEFRKALREVADVTGPQVQLELLPKPIPGALSLGKDETGHSSWIGTRKATRAHLIRARQIRRKHIDDSQQQLENFDENFVAMEPAFDAGAQNVTDALAWLARQRRDAA